VLLNSKLSHNNHNSKLVKTKAKPPKESLNNNKTNKSQFHQMVQAQTATKRRRRETETRTRTRKPNENQCE
jgi:hypothetical protein